jgi:regulatory protein
LRGKQKLSPTITALQLQQRNKERVNLFLDDEFAFGISLFTAASLKKGQQLTAAQVEEIKHSGEVDLAYQRAVRYLGFRPRSEAELATYLQRKGYGEEIAVSVLAKLQREGYLDDEAFARFWVENRQRFRPRGAQALRYELRRKGVDSDTIAEAVEGQDEEAAAWAAVEGKLARWAGLEQADFTKKMMGFLSRRGFGFGICRKVCERAWNSIRENDE